MDLWNESNTVKHAALSLTGEPIAYPKINEFVSLLHEKGISSFVVTNGQYPEQIKKLKPVTQLYISLDAPNKKLMKKIGAPLFEDYWERFNSSLEYLSKKKQRTCLRMTLVKGITMIEPENYAKLIKKSNADFVEVKAYMFIGESRKRLKEENMPSHIEIKKFAKELKEFLPEYELVSEHKPSRIVLLAKKKFKKGKKWFTWIDFKKFAKLSLKKKNFETKDYCRELPKENYLK